MARAPREVVLVLDASLYPAAVVRSAAYLFLDRAWVFLSTRSGDRIAVRLRPRAGHRASVLEGEFENELVNQWQRAATARRNTRLRELIVGRALLGAQLGEDLPVEDADDDYLLDPLGIAVPWEERYGAAATAAAANAPAPGGGTGTGTPAPGTPGRGTEKGEP
jgi:His-Xaa-Ser system protein HxsD